ncbi:hypothetical protein HDK90DRAFT_513083 [Phyllosticta capitalensis]|uniref:Uncharacterized protein n=1 Tax=Phyllosticta capitalensis TaxID=121624 RepID=A0ABR1YGN7_9PEZI
MRSFTTAAFALLAASTAIAAPAPADGAMDLSNPSFLLYEVSAFYVYWSLGHVIETSFDVKSKDTNALIASCSAKAESSIETPPDGEPLYGKCDNKDPGSNVKFAVGGSPGQNYMLWLNNTMSIPCGPQKEYEAKESFGDKVYDCKSLEQNGNSAKCNQKPGAVIELQMNKYYDGPPRELRPRDAQSGDHRC